MVQECQKCGTLFNPQTSEKCPACKMKKNTGMFDPKKTEIRDYRKESIGEMRVSVNSFRRGEVSRYEREKKKDVYQSL